MPNYKFVCRLLIVGAVFIGACSSNNNQSGSDAGSGGAEPTDQSMRNLAGTTLRLLRENLGWMPASIAQPARDLAAHPERALKAFEPLLTRKLTGLRIRTHDDYHLDQVLSTGKDFVIIDFEGPGGERLADRRRKHSPFRDVAGMIRSFHYAAMTAM
ncbi:MAG TPA: hypothetical protein VNO55_30035, partial [Polyangia bacterium]|nr:hypothetical protein [Polyangia bacterium]